MRAWLARHDSLELTASLPTGLYTLRQLIEQDRAVAALCREHL